MGLPVYINMSFKSHSPWGGNAIQKRPNQKSRVDVLGFFFCRQNLHNASLWKGLQLFTAFQSIKRSIKRDEGLVSFTIQKTLYLTDVP